VKTRRHHGKGTATENVAKRLPEKRQLVGLTSFQVSNKNIRGASLSIHIRMYDHSVAEMCNYVLAMLQVIDCAVNN
jgi:putative protein kinase ArgK-like GTPase of G3E family